MPVEKSYGTIQESTFKRDKGAYSKETDRMTVGSWNRHPQQAHVILCDTLNGKGVLDLPMRVATQFL